MEKRIILNNQETHYWIEDTGRLRNEKTKNYLKGAINKGYHFYNIYFQGKQYTLYTHKLVANYFIPNPNNLPIVHHKDGNKLNNNAINLEWVSTEEHQKTINFNGLGAGTRQKININEYPFPIAQFRDSPYYATEDGHIINVSKGILMREESSGKYKRFQGNYNLNGKKFAVHRVIWEAFNGEIPEGYEINHIDGDPSNNALSNLELVTHIENCIKANHNNMKVCAIDEKTYEETIYSSLNQAALAVTGNRKDLYYIQKAIEKEETWHGYIWIYV